jgi:hypothetical protein
MPFISEAKARGFASAVAFGPWASLYERKTDVKRQIFVRFAPIAAPCLARALDGRFVLVRCTARARMHVP